MALVEPDRSRIQARTSASGLLEKDIRSLSAAAGLAVYRPNAQDVSQFREPECLWMALVLAKFPGVEAVKRHYVLVLDYLGDGNLLVVADPHPSSPPVYCVELDLFQSAWFEAKPKRPPWAAALHVPRPARSIPPAPNLDGHSEASR